MEDSDTVEERIKAVTKRKKVYLFLGWPLILIGFIIVFFSVYKPLAISFILTGVVVRFLYYFATSELKSLMKYLAMMDKNTIILFLCLTLFSFNSSLFGQLKRGDDALEFNGVEWIVGDSFKLLKKSDSETPPLTVVEFWASWDKASQLSLPLLSKMQKHYGEEKLVFLAITQEQKDKVQSFLDKSKTTTNFRVGVDPKGIMTKRYLGAGAGFPVIFIIDKNYDILWRGAPLDLEMVLKKIFNKTFDPYLLAKISDLHKKLQEEMQLERIAAAITTIDEIMNLEPDDKLAMRVRLFLFERSGKLADSIPFLDALIKKTPQTSSLYFVKLDVMNRLGQSPEEIKSFCKIIFENFKESPTVLEHLAWIAAFRMSLGTAPLGIALDSIEKAVSLFIESKNSDPAKLAGYLETEARVYYLIGKIAKAVELQERVVKLRNGDIEEKQSKAFAEYYRKALELKNR